MRTNASVLEIEHPRYNFRVSFRETLPNGSAVRRFRYFVKKGEAAAFAAEKGTEIANHGARHATVEDDERAALIKFRTWAAKRPDAPSLSALIEKAIAVHETARPPITVSEAIDLRMDSVDRRKLSARHRGDLQCRLERFRTAFGTLQVADVKLAEVDAWLHRLDVSATTWGNYARAIGSVFSVAVKRGFLPSSPLKGLERPKATIKAPCILTPSQLSALLTAAALELRPLLVLQAFCGLRRAEANRLQWKHIHLDGEQPYVELPSEVTKTNRRRVCHIPVCAVAWLSPAGVPSNFLSLTETVYRDRLNDAATAAKIEWEGNLLRHSFGTYRLAETRNAALVADEMGNSPGVVRTNYQNVTSPEQSAAWWKVIPASPPATAHFPESRTKAS
jgi:integrase